MFELEAFRKQIYCFEESTCDMVGILRRPSSHLAPILIRRPANCAPCPLCYASGDKTKEADNLLRRIRTLTLCSQSTCVPEYVARVGMTEGNTSTRRRNLLDKSQAMSLCMSAFTKMADWSSNHLTNFLNSSQI